MKQDMQDGSATYADSTNSMTQFEGIDLLPLHFVRNELPLDKDKKP